MPNPTEISLLNYNFEAKACNELLTAMLNHSDFDYVTVDELRRYSELSQFTFDELRTAVYELCKRGFLLVVQKPYGHVYAVNKLRISNMEFVYQTLENKQKFISQIMTSKTPARKCEDVDQQALTYSEIKALCTGDERIKEKLMLENEVKELRVLAAEHRNTVFEMEDKIARFPEQEQKLTAILADLHTDREALRKLPIDPERKLPVFKITIGETEYTDRKEAAKALEDAVLAIKYADTPVKVGSFQGFDLSVTVNSNMMGGGMSACLQGAASHTTKLIESFAHNLNRLEAALYNIDGRIERTQDNLAKLRLDHAEAQKIVAEPFPQQEELDTKEQRLKVVTDELNQAAIEAKKNAPKREKTCYFERAKMKRDAARLAKKPRAPKDQTKGRSKKQGIE